MDPSERIIDEPLDDHQPELRELKVASFASDEFGPNLLDYWETFKKNIWISLLLIFLPICIAIVITNFSSRKYTSEVSMIPLSGGAGGGLASLASQFSSLPIIGANLGGLGDEKAKEISVILQSRSLAEKVILKFDLIKELFPRKWDQETGQFNEGEPPLESAVWKFHKKHLSVSSNKKTGLISLQVTLENPELAAKVANAMVLGLQDFINNNSLSVEKRNRIFIEEQLVKNTEKYLQAGKKLDNFYSENNISSVIPEIDVNAGSYQQVPVTFGNFREKFLSLEDESSAVEEKTEKKLVKNVPGQVYLNYLTLNQQILAKSHALLSQQYELAKIEESKEDLAFQVIDWATIKVNPSSPSLKINMAIGAVLGFFLFMGFLFLRTYISKLEKKLN